MIHIIAAIAENGVIGKDNRIPWEIPADLAHFKSLTAGHTVIMGRKTFESIGRILPNRENIIVSVALTAIEGAKVARSLQHALQLASCAEIFIIGGAGLYQEALPLADVLDITHVQLSPEGDTYFPDINWAQYEEVWRKEYNGRADGVPDCTFITYRKK